MITANPTDQIATVAATPAVAPYAHQYDWREDLDMATDYGSTMSLDAAARVAAYIERLEAENAALRLRIEEMSRMVDAGLQVSAKRVIHGE